MVSDTNKCCGKNKTMTNEFVVFATALLLLATLGVLGVIIKMIIDFFRLRREDTHEEENLEAQESFRACRKLTRLEDKDDNDCV